MRREKEMYAEYRLSFGQHVVVIYQWTTDKGGSWRTITNLFCPDEPYARGIVAAFPERKGDKE